MHNQLVVQDVYVIRTKDNRALYFDDPAHGCTFIQERGIAVQEDSQNVVQATKLPDGTYQIVQVLYGLKFELIDTEPSGQSDGWFVKMRKKLASSSKPPGWTEDCTPVNKRFLPPAGRRFVYQSINASSVSIERR